MVSGVRSATIPSIAMRELIARRRAAAASAFGRSEAASVSSKRIWRWRFVGSTKSRSTIRTRPTPARARISAIVQPSAPHPAMRALPCPIRLCPSSPISWKRTWREYRGSTSSREVTRYPPGASILPRSGRPHQGGPLESPRMPAAYTALIFDLDGTLVDSYGPIAESLNQVRRHYGLPDKRVEEVRAEVGRGLDVLIEENVGPERTEEGVRIFRAHYRKVFLSGTKLLPGVRET